MMNLVEILKSKKCSRKDYWTYFGLMWAIFILLIIFNIIINVCFYDEISSDLFFSLITIYFLCLGIIHFLLQIKRLRDAGLSPWWLLLNLSFIFGETFGIIASIIMIVLMCFPTYRIPTTNLTKDDE